MWGGVDPDDQLFLEPAFPINAPPLLPEGDGEHRLIGRAADGAELFSLDFDMREAADSEGGAGFTFVLPVDAAWERDLASITLTGPEDAVTLDRASNLPVAILLDPRSGLVRGILRDDPALNPVQADVAAALGTDTEFEVLFSRGLPDPDAWRR